MRVTSHGATKEVTGCHLLEAGRDEPLLSYKMGRLMDSSQMLLKMQCICCLMLIVLSVSGCSLFEPVLPLEQAVARWVPNDPPGANADRLIGDREIIKSTQAWIKGTPVPRTGGQRLNDNDIQHLVTLWAEQTLLP